MRDFEDDFEYNFDSGVKGRTTRCLRTSSSFIRKRSIATISKGHPALDFNMTEAERVALIPPRPLITRRII